MHIQQVHLKFYSKMLKQSVRFERLKLPIEVQLENILCNINSANLHAKRALKTQLAFVIIL